MPRGKSPKKKMTKTSPKKSPVKKMTKASPKKSPVKKMTKASPRKSPVKKGSRTAGWKKLSPKRGEERRTLMKGCGDECFLSPKTLGYPVCRKCKGSNCLCKVNCKGVHSAYARACQYKNSPVAKKAFGLLKAKCEKRGFVERSSSPCGSRS